MTTVPVLYSRPPPIADLPPPEDLQWCGKTIADLPPLQIPPLPHIILTFTGFIFILLYSYHLSIFYWKIPVIYVTECNSFKIRRHIFEQTIFTLCNTQKD